MGNVITIQGMCAGQPCKHGPGNQIIMREDEVVTVDGKTYHKGCEPTEKEREARRNSYT